MLSWRLFSMGLCDERPIWSMSGSEMLSALDAVQAQIAHLQTYRLQLLAALDANGHAADVGARDTVQLIALRHRLDPTEVRRDLRLATALPKYPEVEAALQVTAPSTTDPADPADASLTPEAVTPGSAVARHLVLHPGQAEAIVTALERIPTTAMVPVADLQVAERAMVRAAQLLSPAE
ncbi:hypothetical protein BWI15_01395, partial [Kribbella sp. ALI-6-A]